MKDPMTPVPPPPSLIERFAAWIAGACRGVMERQLRLPAPPNSWRVGEPVQPEVAGLAVRRLQGIRERFEALVARFRAGMLRPRRVLGPRGPLTQPRAPRAVPDPALPVLRLRFGWLGEVAPGTAGEEIANSVTRMLDDPEMDEMIAVAPDAVRPVVGPLYWALGGHLPERLRPAPKAGAKPRRLPMTRATKASLRAGRRMHAAYLRAKQAEEASGGPPKVPPLPYGFATEADTYVAPVSWGRAYVHIRRR
jgi:hypothetical protein